MEVSPILPPSEAEVSEDSLLEHHVEWPAVRVECPERPSIEGTYAPLYAGRKRHNNFPIWGAGMRRLYSYGDGYWAFAVGSDAPAVGRRMVQSAAPHRGRLPFEMDEWAWWDIASEAWFPANYTKVSKADNVLSAHSSLSHFDPANPPAKLARVAFKLAEEEGAGEGEVEDVAEVKEGTTLDVTPVPQSAALRVSKIPWHERDYGVVLDGRQVVTEIERDSPMDASALQVGDTVVWVKTPASGRCIPVTGRGSVGRILEGQSEVTVGVMRENVQHVFSIYLPRTPPTPKLVVASPPQRLKQARNVPWGEAAKQIPTGTGSVARVQRRLLFSSLEGDALRGVDPSFKASGLRLVQLENGLPRLLTLPVHLPPGAIILAYRVTCTVCGIRNGILGHKPFAVFLEALKRQLEVYDLLGEGPSVSCEDFTTAIPLLVSWGCAVLDAEVAFAQALHACGTGEGPSRIRKSIPLAIFLEWAVQQGLDIIATQPPKSRLRPSRASRSSTPPARWGGGASAASGSRTRNSSVDSVRSHRSTRSPASPPTPTGTPRGRSSPQRSPQHSPFRPRGVSPAPLPSAVAPGWAALVQALPCGTTTAARVRRRTMLMKMAARKGDTRVAAHDLRRGLMDVLGAVGSSHSAAAACAVTTAHQVAIEVCNGPADGSVDKKLFAVVLEALRRHLEVYQVFGASCNPLTIHDFSRCTPLLKSWGADEIEASRAFREMGCVRTNDAIDLPRFAHWAIAQGLSAVADGYEEKGATPTKQPASPSPATPPPDRRRSPAVLQERRPRSVSPASRRLFS